MILPAWHGNLENVWYYLLCHLSFLFINILPVLLESIIAVYFSDHVDCRPPIETSWAYHHQTKIDQWSNHDIFMSEITTRNFVNKLDFILLIISTVAISINLSYLSPDCCGLGCSRYRSPSDNFSFFFPERLPGSPLLADVAAHAEPQDDHHENGSETASTEQGEDSHQVWGSRALG